MRNYFKTFHEYWIEDVSFVTLLVMLLFTIFVLPTLLEFDQAGPPLLNVILVIIFIIGVGSAPDRKWVIITSLLVLAQIIFKVIRIFGASDGFYFLERFTISLNILAFIYINFRLLFRNDDFNHYRVMGGINVYLLIAFLGAFHFELIYLLFGSSIQGPVALTGREQDFAEYIYYSLVCLTTVGFGDYLPVNRPAQMLSVFLSSVGILFPAIIIARLVSMAK